jgi:hypothetical protein
VSAGAVSGDARIEDQAIIMDSARVTGGTAGSAERSVTLAPPYTWRD